MDEIYNQIDLLTQKLADTPYSRRAQAITWKVWEDNYCYDPACLQSIWCRVLQGDKEDEWYLNTNIRFRSNDAYKAAFMNIYALTDLQRSLAERISELTGRKILIGRYVDISDSYHIYGAYFEEIQERFLRSIQERSFEERTWRSDDPRIQFGLKRGREQIEKESKTIE